MFNVTIMIQFKKWLKFWPWFNSHNLMVFNPYLLE